MFRDKETEVETHKRAFFWETMYKGLTRPNDSSTHLRVETLIWKGRKNLFLIIIKSIQRGQTYNIPFSMDST